MPVSALLAISSIQSLNRAWTISFQRASQRSRSTQHSGDISLNDFSTTRDVRIKDLRRRLLSKSYTFSPLRAAILPKKDNGHRIICIPNITDRIVQRSMLNYLTDGDKCGILNSVSFGFVKGKDRGVKSAAKKACILRKKHSWVYKTDITKFFDSMPREQLKDLIKIRVRQKSLHPLLFSAIDCEINEPLRSRRQKISAAGIKSGRGVRQGMPLSPLFANFILRDFDKAIERNHYKMVRYADDLIILADSESQCHEIHEFCETELSKINLSIPLPGVGLKTQIYPPNEPAEFLGVGLVKAGSRYTLKILQDQKEKILQQLSDSMAFTELVKRGITIGKLNQRLDGIISGYLSAYEFCENLPQFELALNETKTNALMKIFENGLGIKLSTLTPEQKHFLGF